ncbi:hypothetical protein MRX96_005470 [Rhipicephalus microplus]
MVSWPKISSWRFTRFRKIASSVLFERSSCVTAWWLGIKDKQLSARLQLDAELTLQKALDSVRQSESVQAATNEAPPGSATFKQSCIRCADQSTCFSARQKWQLYTRGKQAIFTFR